MKYEKIVFELISKKNPFFAAICHLLPVLQKWNTVSALVLWKSSELTILSVSVDFQEIAFPKMVASCCRFLCYFCRISRQNQKAMFDHLSYLLENSSVGLGKGTSLLATSQIYSIIVKWQPIKDLAAFNQSLIHTLVLVQKQNKQNITTAVQKSKNKTSLHTMTCALKSGGQR